MAPPAPLPPLWPPLATAEEIESATPSATSVEQSKSPVSLLSAFELDLGDQQRSQHRQPEAGSEVAHGLRDAGRLAVARSGNAVERVGADRGEHQPGACARDDDPPPVGAVVHGRHRLGPEVEPDRADRAAERRRAPSPRPCRASRRRAGRRGCSRRRTCRCRGRRCEASSPSEIWEYRLANRNIGTNAIETRNRIALSTANALFLKKRMLHQRVVGAELGSRTNASVSATPTTMRPIVRASSQPHTLDCCRPSTMRPIPDREEDEPAVIDGSGPAGVVGLGLDRHHDRGEGDRDVDPEDRPPGDLDQVAAGERAEGGHAAGDAEEDRERLAALALRVGGDDDRQRGREHDRRADALDDRGR